MKKTIILLAIVFALAAPLFAQSTFSDVPRDHWAYDAVSELESLGARDRLSRRRVQGKENYDPLRIRGGSLPSAPLPG